MGQFKPEDEKQKKAYVQHINNTLQGDRELEGLPINPDNDDVLEVNYKGVLLCKMVNKVEPATVDEKKILFQPKNKFEAIANHTLAINGATKIGCKIVGISPSDLADKKPFAFLGIIWQIIRRDLTKSINSQNPIVQSLRKEGEDAKTLIDLSAEEIVLRWMNKLIASSGSTQNVRKFGDCKDGDAYCRVLSQVDKNFKSDEALNQKDNIKRLQLVLDQAKKMGCPVFVTPEGLATGDDNLNMALACQLFYAHSTILKAQEDSITKRSVGLDDELSMESEEQAEQKRRKKKEEEDKLVREREEMKKKLEEEAKQKDAQREQEARQRASQMEEDAKRRASQMEEDAKRREREMDDKAKQREMEMEEKARMKEREMEEAARRREQELEDQMNARLREKERALEEAARKREEEMHSKLKEKEEEEARRRQTEDEQRRKQMEEEEERRREEARKRQAEEDRLKKELESQSTREITKEIVKEVVVVKEVVKEEKISFDFGTNKAGYRKVFLTVLEGRNMIACNLVNKKSDPFVVCKHYSAEGELKTKMKTKIIQNNHVNPQWDETMEYRDVEEGDMLAITVWDDGKTGYDFMGEIRFMKNEIRHGVTDWYKLSNLPKRPSHPAHEKKKQQKKEQEKAKEASNPLVKKQGFSFSSMLHGVSNTRNAVKDKIRGKKEITGELKLAFETIY